MAGERLSDSIDTVLDTRKLVALRRLLLDEEQSDRSPPPHLPTRELEARHGSTRTKSVMDLPSNTVSRWPKSRSSPSPPPHPPHDPSPHTPYLAPKLRPTSNTDFTPRLVSSKSSPILGTLDDEHKRAAARMYRTFAGVLDDPGDTQPIQTQIFENLRDNDLGEVEGEFEWINEPHLGDGTLLSDDDTNNNGVEDDDGNGEVCPTAYEAEHSDQAVSSDEGFTPDELDSVRQPKTPGVAGRKRDYRGDLISPAFDTSATKTPGIRSLFRGVDNEGDGPHMSLTQIFTATQAASSPQVDNLHSDLVFQRPSPNFNHQHYPAMFSPDQDQDLIPTVPLGNHTPSGRLLDQGTSCGISMNGETPATLWRVKESIAPSSDLLYTPGVPSVRKLHLPFAIPEVSQDQDDIALAGRSEAEQDKMAVEVPMTSSRPGVSSLRTGSPQRNLVKRAASTQSKGHLAKEYRASGVPEEASRPSSQLTVAVLDSREMTPEDAYKQGKSQPLPVSSHSRISQSQHTSHVTASQKISGRVSTPNPVPDAPRMPSSPPYTAAQENEEDAMKDEDEDAHSSRANEYETARNGDALESPLRAPQHSRLPSEPMNGDHECMEAEERAQVEGLDKIDVEIPTEVIQPEDAHSLHAKRKNTSSFTQTNDSGDHDVFNTTESQVSTTSTGPFRSQVSHLQSESPMTGPPKRLTEIDADRRLQPSQSFGSLEFNLNNIVTDEDQNFLDAISSPPRPPKRRKVYTTKVRPQPAPPVGFDPESLKKSLGERSRSPLSPTEAPNGLETEADMRPTFLTTPAVPRKTAFPEKRNALKKGKLKRPTKLKELDASRATSSATPKATRKRPLPATAVIAETPQPRPTHAFVQKPMGSSEKAIAGNLMSIADAEPSAWQPGEADDGKISPALDPEQCVPNRVFALFKGTTMAYYPATCIGVSNIDGTRFRIRFDDGTIDILDHTRVRSLDLRIGDAVKVDTHQMRTKTYVVRGFTHRIAVIEKGFEQDVYPLTDVRGYQTVRLAAKKRGSFPAPDMKLDDIVDIPLTSIYVTASMWTRFADRHYSQPPSDRPHVSRISTPSVMPTRPVTPNSRSRRSIIGPAQVSYQRDRSTASTHTELPFANMAFAVTLTGTTDRERICKLIRDNGGLLLESGFDELFDPITPDDGALYQLRLTHMARSLGFTALLADKHSRRAKYVQALALNIPCLHYRWLLDSLAASTTLPFHKYLLPAGESAFLSGVIRSRYLKPYHPQDETAQLTTVFDHREKMLAGKSVLFVMGKGKAEERRKAYLFLTYALGAEHVSRVRDLKEAKAELERDGVAWYWCYADGDLADAERILFGGKDRERGAKVVGDEFVVQSLILGALMEA
ncbi:hypothetical protein EJ06DRAFT_580242 [Trichodelitschia bisporula]|uniref:BRCT domain-containing protein n=1 Tax=Trichodelitschia bisporula TaxID=703511 RepID=A0A6G1I4R6_9PEZI|nr:hypothetical protein EJ06DRAFT_580242 [Trichodelitschia bisporula]